MNWPTGAPLVLFIVFGSLFLLASLVNLVSSFFEHEKVRRLSKPFCMLFLGIAVACLAPQQYLVYCGCFCGFVGDVFLIYKNKMKCVLSGLLFFLFGHLFYIASIITFLAGKGFFEWWSYGYMALYFVLMLGIMFLPIFDFTKHSKVFTTGGTLYATVLVSVMSAAILGCSLGYDHYFYVTIIGALLFIVSDLILSFTLFKHDIKRRDFYIMFTYLAGQACIVMGILMTVL